MKHWGRTKMILTVLVTIALTVLVVVIALNFGTPEKQLERRIEHRYAVADPQFRARDVGAARARRSCPATGSRTCRTATRSSRRCSRPSAARRRPITFETYIYWSGEIGKQFADALAERARAGVRGPRHHRLGRQRQDGRRRCSTQMKERRRARSQRYRPLHWYNLGRLNNRTHRKLLVVDGTVGFTGGVGIADTGTGTRRTPITGATCTSAIEGPVVAQMQAAFNDNWIKTTRRGAQRRRLLPAAGARSATWTRTCSSLRRRAAARACT